MSIFPIAFDKTFKLDLPSGHRFPMNKYKLLPEEIINSGTATKIDFFKPTLPKKKDLLITHEKKYLNKLLNLNLDKSEVRKIGFPLSSDLIKRELLIAGGTIQGAIKSIKYGVSMNIAGGTHHAFSNKGEGFCLLNDQAIAANYLIKHKGIRRILIIDLDVHQGNGTAQIFNSEPNVFTFSMHGKKNYPFKKEKSDLDIELKDNTSDVEYLNILKNILPRLINKFKPEFIFYLAGVDVIQTDKLGRLSLSIKGCEKRDEIVFSMCKKEKIPIQCSMGGGYSENIDTIVDAHLNTFKIAKKILYNY